VFIYHSGWNGVPYSDGSWADTVNFGSGEFLFLENNVFVFEGVNYAITDAYRGARFVIRYNQIYNGWVEAHGSDSANRERGTRAMEIYSNTYSVLGGQANNGYLANYRSGTGVVYGNIATNYTSPQMTMSAYRMLYPFVPWGEADGTNGWDVNVGGGPFDSGTATGGAASQLIDTGKAWTPSQWIGWSVQKTTTPGEYRASSITANTSDTLTLHDGGGYPALTWDIVQASPAPTTTSATVSSGTAFTVGDDISVVVAGHATYRTRLSARTGADLTWSPAIAFAPAAGDTVRLADIGFVAGDTYQIWKVGELLDQPGRGQGTQLSGLTPSIPVGWNDQVDEPLYEWDNVTSAGADIDWSVPFPEQIRSGEHYYSDTPKPGYVPYTYPHPLTGGNANATFNNTLHANTLIIGP